jgi:CheY-like chemotaxis protein
MNALRPILLVEDNPNDIELTLAALDDARIANEKVVANDGEAALDYLLRRGAHSGRVGPQPAVILLDLKMPRMDGHEVLKAIRAQPELRHIPVVILTSSREESDLCASYERGANAYVVKPVDFADFTEAINKIGFFWALLNEPPVAPPAQLPAAVPPPPTDPFGL